MITLNKLIITVLALLGLVAVAICMTSCATTDKPIMEVDDWSYYYGPLKVR